MTNRARTYFGRFEMCGHRHCHDRATKPSELMDGVGGFSILPDMKIDQVKVMLAGGLALQNPDAPMDDLDPQSQALGSRWRQ